ncbi:hypothetical protein B0H14DRAFT_3721535 [Mycena olivaceomarginata]|nr:hypothetical protein B0H14DRAFT_3721535 [Mycena olivaceomarginata]
MPPPLHQPPAQQPTCTNLRIRSVEDAHKIFFAIRSAAAALKTGCVYAWEERSPNTEITDIGIERFTEGRRWSASRVRDEFLFYYEKWVPDPNQGSRNEPMGWEQLVKQTYSVWVETGQGKRKWHLKSTVDQLGTVDDIPDVRHLQSSVARVYAAFPSPLPPIAPRPTKSTSAGARPPSPVRMYEPYSRPQSRTRMQSPTTYHSPHYTHPGSSTLQSPGLHYSYPSPQNLSEIAQPPYNYTREIHERPPPPAEFSATRYIPDTQHNHNPGIPQVDGSLPQLCPISLAPALRAPTTIRRRPPPRPTHRHPTAPLYPLFSGFESGSSTQSLPRLLMPVEPTPFDLISDSDERRGEIGPCRDLAPLNSLTRSHPYRRDPMDDKTLRLLGPRQSLTRDPSPN